MKLRERLTEWLEILLALPTNLPLEPLLLALKQYRRGPNIRTLAVHAGLEEKTVSRILSEKVKTPHLETIEALSNELEKSPEELGLGAAYAYRLRNAEKKQR